MNELEDNGEKAIKADEINARGAVTRDATAVSRGLEKEREGGVTTGADSV